MEELEDFYRTTLAPYVAEYDMRFPLIACFIGHDHSIVVGRYHEHAPPDLLARYSGSGGTLQPMNVFVVSTVNNVGIRLIVHADGQITAHH
jgi:hypothetical protein